MKLKFGFFVALISTSLLADQPATSPAASTSPAPTRSSVRKAAAELRSVPLEAGPAVVAANNVNVRGRAGLIGEVITRMTNGEPVTVIEEIVLKNSRPDEPTAWAKIALPARVPVWVNASYIDNTTKTVKPRRLNLRGGPGENYSVLGTLQQGDAVHEIETRGEWMKIEAPTNAFAYMAAQYLKQEAPAPTPEPEPAPITIAEAPQVAPAPADLPSLPAPSEMPAPEISSLPPEPAVEEPPPPRIVQREGIVRGTFSIQAPTPYELISPDNRRPINYLHTTSTNLDLGRYKGLHIIVTGEEGLDERWRNTPVITIQRIQVLQ